MTKFGVSQPVRRREDNRLLTGAGGFVDDLSPGSLAFGYALRSPVASGRILSLEAAAARRSPGVLLVLTAADLAGSAVSPIACLVKPAAREGTTFSEYPQPIPVRDDVHYAGDTVAFVVAESADAARDAAELIEVDYEPGPAATGCARATW